MSLIGIAEGIRFFFLALSLTPVEDQQDLMQFLQRSPVSKEPRSSQELL